MQWHEWEAQRLCSPKHKRAALTARDHRTTPQKSRTNLTNQLSDEKDQPRLKLSPRALDGGVSVSVTVFVVLSRTVTETFDAEPNDPPRAK